MHDIKANESRMSNENIKTRIVIVDDHPMMRDGLTLRVTSQPGWEVCGVAATEDEGFAVIAEQCPDLVLVDISLKNGNGIELIKRVIALPGDTVMIQGETVYLNNEPISETYIKNPTEVIAGGKVLDGEPVTIEPGYMFLMGDNREGSSDSREFGPVPESLLVGQVVYRYFPINRMGVINNPLSYRQLGVFPQVA